MNKLIIWTIAILVILGASLGLYYKRNIERLAFVGTLFTGAEQYDNFNSTNELFPIKTMPAAKSVYNFAEGEKITLPDSFKYRGKTVSVANFLADTDTSSLLVIKDGQVRFERYMLTGGRNVQWLSMSVAKSFISTGIGIAVDQDLIDIEKPITDYVPSLLGSAYDKVRIKDILQMSSGAAWNEDYNDSESDVNRLGRIMALGGSLDEFSSTMKRQREPGTFSHYNSIDTQVLGMLLARATGQSVSQYLAEKIWQPLGMESDGYWLVDDNDVEMAFSGLNATARDYAKLGELFRLDGLWQGKQLISKSWVHDATTADAPHIMPGVHDNYPMGYGYQWWLPESDEKEFSAIGVYNQFIYVNPSQGLVIVKLSANSDYGTSLDESAYREVETMTFFRAITKQL